LGNKRKEKKKVMMIIDALSITLISATVVKYHYDG